MQRSNQPRTSHGPTFYLASSRDDWKPHEMIWNPLHSFHFVTLELGEAGFERFQILVEGDWSKRLHPVRKDACIHTGPDLCGPDADSHGINWVIGKHPSDDGGRKGVCYEIRLYVDADGNATHIDWVRFYSERAVVWGTPGVLPGLLMPEARYWVVGSWNDWKSAREMNWDPARQCFHYTVGTSGQEKFQILVEGDWDWRIYPAEEDGTFHAGHLLSGPDADGHGKNFLIGRHPLDGEVKGAFYEIRLRLTSNCMPLYVDWVRLWPPCTTATARCPEEAMKSQSQPSGSGGQEDLEGTSASVAELLELLEIEEQQDALRRYYFLFPAQPSSSTSANAEIPELASAARVPALPCPQSAPSARRDEIIAVARNGDANHSTRPTHRCLSISDRLADCAIRTMQRELQSAMQHDDASKQAARSKYDIGWQPAHLPSEAERSILRRLCYKDPGATTGGPYCLALESEEGRMSVRVAVAGVPAVATNLAYLALALQVGLREGREVLFSLDPLESEHPVHSHADGDVWMQTKTFEPAWLAGTSVGEVLFQADYYLKEVSMGDAVQPVLGMLSCVDLALQESSSFSWLAREWFKVTRAAVYLTDDHVLLPDVALGVEAREQVQGVSGSLEDKELTRPDHPLVKYAEDFSANFDLIAERKSVIYHLRELARASVLAKFLLDAAVGLERQWFVMADEEMGPCVMEIPQLWAKRLHKEINVQEGRVVDVGETGATIYGGVEFGLGRFSVAGVRAPSVRGRVSLRGIHATSVQPHGVDLNLGRFDLSEVRRVSQQKGGDLWSGPCLSPDGAPLQVGEAFWTSLSALDEGAGHLDAPRPLGAKEDLLRAVFCPLLCDRRMEGRSFVPPDPAPGYIERLRVLVDQEEHIRRERKCHFLSEEFRTKNVGPLFASCWSTAMEIAKQDACDEPIRSPAVNVDENAVMDLLRYTTPIFDKSTEDGTRFRIYARDQLEVRTIEDYGGVEAVEGVFCWQ